MTDGSLTSLPSVTGSISTLSSGSPGSSSGVSGSSSSSSTDIVPVAIPIPTPPGTQPTPTPPSDSNSPDPPPGSNPPNPPPGSNPPTPPPGGNPPGPPPGSNPPGPPGGSPPVPDPSVVPPLPPPPGVRPPPPPPGDDPDDPGDDDNDPDDPDNSDDPGPGPPPGDDPSSGSGGSSDPPQTLLIHQAGQAGVRALAPGGSPTPSPSGTITPQPTPTTAPSYHDGSLWEGTTPPGAAPGVVPQSDAFIAMFAQVVDVRTCEANAGPRKTYAGTGCSLAAPPVAGLAAALLAYPLPGQNPFDPNDKGWTGFSTITRTADNSTLSMSTTTSSFNSSTTSGSSTSSSTASKTSSMSKNSTTSKTSTAASSSTSAVSSSAPSSGGAWTLSLFSEPACKGEQYNFTQLSEGPISYCVSEISLLETDRGNVSCTYGSGESTEAKRDGGTWPFQPKSWYLGNGYCNLWRDDKCLRQVKGGISYDNHVGCSNARGDLSKVQSISCSPRTASCKACIECRLACLELLGSADKYQK
ncbi:hypothetical protein LA080_013301 [Diaporthe eres]|nr:hypothetical protein LA080_013301 [Diaporthe eres]